MSIKGRTKDQRIYLYTLSHVETGVVVYVGQTANVRSRVGYHGRFANTESTSRLANWLRNNDGCFALSVIQIVDGDNADDEEQKLIKHFVQSGVYLLNQQRYF